VVTPRPERALSVGDRLKLSGGYDDARWLGGRPAVFGRATSFIPGQNVPPALVVRLDEPLEVDGVRGDIVVLELRYVGSDWGRSGTIHVELCDFEPERKRWQDRRQGRWVESNATYEVVG